MKTAKPDVLWSFFKFDILFTHGKTELNCVHIRHSWNCKSHEAQTGLLFSPKQHDQRYTTDEQVESACIYLNNSVSK